MKAEISAGLMGHFSISSYGPYADFTSERKTLDKFEKFLNNVLAHFIVKRSYI